MKRYAALGILVLVAGLLLLDRSCAREGLDRAARQSGIEGISTLRDVRSGDVSFSTLISGRMDPREIASFIERNGLRPDPEAENVRYMSEGEARIRKWVGRWPDHPDWYSRRMPLPKDTCRGHCYALCLVDRSSGWVLVVLEGPDFAGD